MRGQWGNNNSKGGERNVRRNNEMIMDKAKTIMGAMAGYMCDNYWFCDKPNKDEMFCGGRKYESFYKI